MAYNYFTFYSGNILLKLSLHALNCCATRYILLARVAPYVVCLPTNLIHFHIVDSPFSSINHVTSHLSCHPGATSLGVALHFLPSGISRNFSSRLCSTVQSIFYVFFLLRKTFLLGKLGTTCSRPSTFSAFRNFLPSLV
jgi:hypothetical protein